MSFLYFRAVLTLHIHEGLDYFLGGSLGAFLRRLPSFFLSANQAIGRPNSGAFVPALVRLVNAANYQGEFILDEMRCA
jgi:hypothetical protein